MNNAQDNGEKKMKQLSTQRLHGIIRKAIGQKCSFYSPSQRVDRTTYDVNTMFHGFYGVLSCKYMHEIRDAVKAAGLIFDDSEIERGFIKVKRFQ
jgi:hypothetical protein